MERFKIGFWNYPPIGRFDVEQAVEDWVELGFNLPLTFSYNPDAVPKKSDVDGTKEVNAAKLGPQVEQTKEGMLACLDAWHKKGHQAFVYDNRTNFRTLEKIGEEAFEKGVKQAVADFGWHPAAYGFHIGDEPSGEQWEIAIKAYQIVKKYSPDKVHFLNLLPIWGGANFKEQLGCTQDEYSDKIADMMQRMDTKLIGYDFYSQCTYNTPGEDEMYEYFKNLNCFRAAASRVGGEFINSILSVGHWNYREPNDHDFRFQIATSIAHGADGWFYFYIYETGMHESYRRPIIDMFGKRTPNFDLLAWHNKVAQKYYGEALTGYKFDKVWHAHKSYGGTPAFEGNDELESIEHIVNPFATAITRFVNDEGKVAYGITNLNREKPMKIRPHFTGKLAKYNDYDLWYGPGQIYIFTEEKRY